MDATSRKKGVGSRAFNFFPSDAGLGREQTPGEAKRQGAITMLCDSINSTTTFWFIASMQII